MKILPVILAGGSGTRLWPISREAYPKQFLTLIGENSFLSQTLMRFSGRDDFMPPLLICNKDHRFLAAEQARASQISLSGLLLEPSRKNTAAAVTVASLWAAEHEADALIILPADHYVSKDNLFLESVYHGLPAVEKDFIVLFGVAPKRPETAYGYFKKGLELDENCFMVEKFFEKPDLDTAKKFFSDNTFFWNAGIFLARPEVVLSEIETASKDLYRLCKQALAEGRPDLDFYWLASEPFAQIESESFDRLVLERSDRVAAVELASPWSDIGSWDSLWEILPKDQSGNVLSGDAVALETEDCLVFSERQLITALGLKDLIIVASSDVVFVADKTQSQRVKELVQKLRLSGRPEATEHAKTFRPWGFYESLLKEPRFQVKLITVNPGEKLSLQYHYHRAEHWIVVKGVARVRCGEKTIILGENESTYIPRNTIHSLSNPGKIPLEIIEIQSGSYLGEDDIVRIEDKYGRTSK